MHLRFTAALCALWLAPFAASAQDAEEDDAAPEEQVVEVAPDDEVAPADEPVAEEPEPLREPEPDDAPASNVASEVRQREDVRPWHVGFGTATGIVTYATTILGFLTFNDRYGWTGNGLDSGCGSGNAIFGAAACADPPWSHLISASTASALFAVTFTLALFMPDPLDVANSGGEQGTLLTIHKALRWGLLGLFVAQLVLGSITALADFSDFDTQRAFATTHLVLGVTTNVAMTTQGVLGSIMEW